MTRKYIEIVKTDKIGTIFLNRPEVRNAMNSEMIAELIAALKAFANDPHIKALIIRGKNRNFSSGADLNWIQESGLKSPDQNLAASRQIAELMETLRQVPVPLISVAEGASFGGAIGMLACSDFVMADKNALFAFSEVRLGLAPVIIMPYVLRRTKSLKIKQLMLTGQRFDAWVALDTGLVDQVNEIKELNADLEKLVQTFIGLPGNAVREIKHLWEISQPLMEQGLTEITVHSLSALKQSPEAQGLMNKFLQKK